MDDPIYNRDKFLISEKHLRSSETYYVLDEHEEKLLYVEQYTNMLRNFLALITGFIIGALFIYTLISVADFIESDIIKLILYIIAIAGGFGVIVIVFTLRSQKRHLIFYRGNNKIFRYMEIIQDNMFEIPYTTYSLKDNNQQLLARIQKDSLRALYCTSWQCITLDGTILCVVREESKGKSLFRHSTELALGKVATKLTIFDGTNERVLGEFDRRSSTLDLSSDDDRLFNRKIAVALGVLLTPKETRIPFNLSFLRIIDYIWTRAVTGKRLE